jgi:hypothetical protein
MASTHIRNLFAASCVALCAACATPEAQQPAEAPRPASPAARASPAPAPPPAPRSAPAPAPVPGKAEQLLAQGIQSYDDGERKLAAKQLQGALDLGLDSKRDQARAHKYLAFIVCVSGREKTCREQFRKALDADPAFELEPAEAGNPVWSAALKSVMAERAKAKAKQGK